MQQVARIYNMCCQSGAVLQEELSFLTARQPSMRQVLACVKHVCGKSRFGDSNNCASQCKEAMVNTLHMHPHPTVEKTRRKHLWRSRAPRASADLERSMSASYSFRNLDMFDYVTGDTVRCGARLAQTTLHVLLLNRLRACNGALLCFCRVVVEESALE